MDKTAITSSVKQHSHHITIGNARQVLNLAVKYLKKLNRVPEMAYLAESGSDPSLKKLYIWFRKSMACAKQLFQDLTEGSKLNYSPRSLY